MLTRSLQDPNEGLFPLASVAEAEDNAPPLAAHGHGARTGAPWTSPRRTETAHDQKMSNSISIISDSRHPKFRTRIPTVECGAQTLAVQFARVLPFLESARPSRTVPQKHTSSCSLSAARGCRRTKNHLARRIIWLEACRGEVVLITS